MEYFGMRIMFMPTLVTMRPTAQTMRIRTWPAAIAALASVDVVKTSAREHEPYERFGSGDIFGCIEPRMRREQDDEACRHEQNGYAECEDLKQRRAASIPDHPRKHSLQKPAKREMQRSKIL